MRRPLRSRTAPTTTSPAAIPTGPTSLVCVSLYVVFKKKDWL
ncbi:MULTISPECIES: hypothetical protein [unclassified Streptomyces]